jgi:hypothetical protein
MFSDKVYLKEDTHQYFCRLTGKEYSSMSAVKKSVKNDFKDSFAYKNASQQKRDEWTQKGIGAATLGTRNHLALETYAKTASIPDELSDLYPMVKSIFSLFHEYDRVYSEQVLYSDTYGVAGTADKICAKKSKSKVKYIDIYDYKNYEKGIEFVSKYDQWMKSPLDYLQDCRFNDVALQLAGYGLMAKEQFPDVPVRKLSVIVIPPNDPLNWQCITLPFMYAEAQVLFKHFDSLPKKQF